jgi:hypothetical protein
MILNGGFYKGNIETYKFSLEVTMSSLIKCVVCIGLSFTSGCTWQRIEAPPGYMGDRFPCNLYELDHNEYHVNR